jgi:hypothetical protein
VEGKTVRDATNRIGVETPEGFASNAPFVKSRTRGPTAKSFNINSGRLRHEPATVDPARWR